MPLPLEGAAGYALGADSVEGGVDMFWEILIGAAVMTLVTVLFTGPGMWSSSWGWKDKQKGKDPSKPDV